MKPAATDPQIIAACPFRGLVPYFEQDAEYFFGRESDKEIIVANCLTTRVTLLYGASGVGKSSVLYAGVMRELRRRAETNLAERECPECAGVAFSSWRDDPVEGLRQRVKSVLKELLPGSWTAQLPPGQGTLTDAFRVWTQFMQSDLVLLLDQFEEYFLYRDAHDESFADELVAAVSDPDLRVNVLISLREDALARLDTFKARIPSLFDNCLRLDHLTESAARLAITEPVKLYNTKQTDPARRVEIDPALVGEVVDQVRAGRLNVRAVGSGEVRKTNAPTSGVRHVEAPYLQMVMMRLWREDIATGGDTLRLATLDRLGGAQQIVRTHLDLVMDRFTTGERQLASRVFHQLVTPSGTKIAHYVSDLADYAHTPAADVGKIFERLDHPEARVMRDVTPPGATSKRYEIFHDLLAAPILDWRQRFVQRQIRWRSRRRWSAIALGLAGLIGFVSYGMLQRQKQVSARLRVENSELAEGDERWKEAYNDQHNALQRSVAAFDQQLSAVGGNTVIVEAAQAALKERELPQTQPAPIPAPRAPGAVAAIPEAALAGAEDFVTDKVFSGHERDVWTARYSTTGPDGSRFLLTAGRDRTARIWDLRGDADFVLSGHTAEVNTAEFNPAPGKDRSGWFAATASDDKTVRLWKRAVPNSWKVLAGHTEPVSGLEWSRDGRWLVSTGMDGRAFIWDLQDAALRGPAATLGQQTAAVMAPDLCETSAGSWLVTPSADGTARVWDFPSGKPSPNGVLQHGAPVRRAVFNSTGKFVLTGGKDGRAILWDRASGRKLHEIFHDKAVFDVAFAPGRPRFATASWDNSSQVWDASALPPKPVLALKGHTAPVCAVRFTANGEGVVTASWDRTARLWSISEQRCLAVLRGHANVLWSVQFSPAANTFTTTSADGTARLWDLNVIPGGRAFLPPPAAR